MLICPVITIYYTNFFDSIDLKKSKITIFFINFFSNQDLKMSKLYIFLSYTNIAL